MNEEEMNRLRRLWAEAYLRLQEMGRILTQQPSAEVLGEKLGIKELELTAVKRDKNGNIVHEQKIRATGGGKILEHKRWDKGVKNG